MATLLALLQRSEAPGASCVSGTAQNYSTQLRHTAAAHSHSNTRHTDMHRVRQAAKTVHEAGSKDLCPLRAKTYAL